MPATDVQAKLKVVRLHLPPEDHHALRRLAADENTSMAILARRVIQAYIREPFREAPKPKRPKGSDQ